MFSPPRCEAIVSGGNQRTIRLSMVKANSNHLARNKPMSRASAVKAARRAASRQNAQRSSIGTRPSVP